jgi:hypothetical protein
LFQDGLTKQVLMDSLAMVNQCKVFVNWKMIQMFRDNPKSADSASISEMCSWKRKGL